LSSRFIHHESDLTPTKTRAELCQCYFTRKNPLPHPHAKLKKKKKKRTDVQYKNNNVANKQRRKKIRNNNDICVYADRYSRLNNTLSAKNNDDCLI
jgi:hypothetical protein